MDWYRLVDAMSKVCYYSSGREILIDSSDIKECMQGAKIFGTLYLRKENE